MCGPGAEHDCPSRVRAEDSSRPSRPTGLRDTAAHPGGVIGGTEKMAAGDGRPSRGSSRPPLLSLFEGPSTPAREDGRDSERTSGKGRIGPGGGAYRLAPTP